MVDAPPTRVIITGGTTEAPEAPTTGPSLYPTLDVASALEHIVSRPDLVSLDDDGNVKETATLVVGGRIFEDWETVWIQWAWAAEFSVFRFTCAEREPYPLPGEVLQFKPGDEVEIFLGGIRVIKGPIISRQVAYDPNQHMVQLQGVSNSWLANRSSIQHKTSDFSNKSFEEIAKEILAPTGVGYKKVGDISEEKFKVARNESGETIGQFLERLARDRKIIISNTPDGNFLFVGEHTWPQVGELIEGVNIKKMQCVITDETAYSQYFIRAQTVANDAKNGRKTSEQEATVKGSLSTGYSILITAIEHPVWNSSELIKRAETEKMWNEDINKIDATVTVYGWFRPLPTTIESWATQKIGNLNGHTLWQAGDEVMVESPMAMLRKQPLKIKAVTWMQDSTNGTQTVLNLTTPQGLNGMPIARDINKAIINEGAAVTPAQAAAPGPGQTAPM